MSKTSVAGYAHEAGRVLLSWSTNGIQSKDTNTCDFEAEIRDEFQYLDYAPIILCSH